MNELGIKKWGFETGEKTGRNGSQKVDREERDYVFVYVVDLIQMSKRCQLNI